MREVTEYKWEQLKERIHQRCKRLEQEKESLLQHINTWEGAFEKIKQLIECETRINELAAYHRILKTMDDLEQEE